MRIEYHLFDPHHRGVVSLTMGRPPPTIKELYRDISVTEDV